MWSKHDSEQLLLPGSELLLVHEAGKEKGPPLTTTNLHQPPLTSTHLHYLHSPPLTSTDLHQPLFLGCCLFFLDKFQLDVVTDVGKLLGGRQ